MPCACLRRLSPDEWPALAAFVRARNLRPDGKVRCLHAEQGSSVDDQAAELAALAPDEACFIAAGNGDGLRGMIGAEIDIALGRAWLRGPLVAHDDSALRIALITALLEALPAVRRLDAFVQVDEAALRADYRAAGFRDVLRHHVLRLVRDAAQSEPQPAVHDASADEARAAARLHERLFPASYLSAEALQNERDADHRLLVVCRAGAVAGYLYVRHRPLEHDAYVDYFGVEEAARGFGLGRALLDAAVHWALRERGFAHLDLTVAQDRAPALGLYLGCGFREVAAGAHLMLERQGVASP